MPECKGLFSLFITSLISFQKGRPGLKTGDFTFQTNSLGIMSEQSIQLLDFVAFLPAGDTYKEGHAI